MCCSGSASSSCSVCNTRRVTVKWHEHHLTWKSCWTPLNTNNIDMLWESVSVYLCNQFLSPLTNSRRLQTFIDCFWFSFTNKPYLHDITGVYAPITIVHYSVTTSGVGTVRPSEMPCWVHLRFLVVSCCSIFSFLYYTNITFHWGQYMDL